MLESSVNRCQKPGGDCFFLESSLCGSERPGGRMPEVLLHPIDMPSAARLLPHSLH